MRTRLATAFLLTWVVPIAAQDLPVFRANTDVVVVPVTVTDRSGRFVRGLTADQFEVSDGGSRHPIAQFSADRVPVSLGIMLDISGSMTQDPNARAADDVRWADTRRALELLVTKLDARDDVFFAAFAEKVGVALPWTSEHSRIVRAFDALRPGGRTALFNALRLIAPAFQLARYPRKALLLISDGQDTSVSNSAIARATDKIEMFGNLGSSIAVNPQREAAIVATRSLPCANLKPRCMPSALARAKACRLMLRRSNGLRSTRAATSSHSATHQKSPSAVARICDDLQSQYLLAFEPAHADGKFHPISIKLKDGRLKVRARSGYFARHSEPPP